MVKLQISFALLICLYSGKFAPLVQTAPAEYQNSNEVNEDLFEGDILLPLSRNGFINKRRHWPNKTVHYKIADIFNEKYRKTIHRAMRRIEEVSCLKFVPVEPHTKAYINIVSKKKGCFAEPGYQGRRQTVNLRTYGCVTFGITLHELLHALGFLHQQNAPNRDDYVKIVKENIQPKYLGNFKKYSNKTLTDFGIPYDYRSIMHYASWMGSKNKKATIVPVDPKARIGQRKDLSEGDIAKLNIMYKCNVSN